MVDLYCAPFIDLIDRMRLESARRGSIFDLPAKKFHRPHGDEGAPDLACRFHDRIAGAPVGPAAGPQTQMAQNLVLSWLAGARILELKTVQIDDRLEIPRPCIDAPNVCYNVEWSQELRIADSLDQYVQGAMLIHALRHAPGVFGRPFGDADLRGTWGETIYDVSVGYDLAGIRSDPVRRFMESMIDARAEVERLRGLIPARLKPLRDLDYPTDLSRSVTLSTFHGCPADEIERIGEFLLRTIDVDVIVKMNPPMLGRERLEHLLHDVLGYDDLVVNPGAYESGLAFDDAVDLCRRLADLAGQRSRRFGAKFSNTLEVLNHRDFFTPENEVMYLSGQPLHVLALTLADDFRRAVGPDVPISFSAGIDRRNVADAVACGFVPVTTCTDLLRPGGYARLPGYHVSLAEAMTKVGARAIDDFIRDARGRRDAVDGDVGRAAAANLSIIAAEARENPRYRSNANRAVPKRIDSHLVVFDCITCNKCVPVCPNDANFLYPTAPVDLTYRDARIDPDGRISRPDPTHRFTVERADQIANLADFCNHCGNCDTFCPEYDGPYLEKPSFFLSRESFDTAADHDGFLLVGDTGAVTLHGRIKGAACRLDEMAGERGLYRFTDGTATILTDDTATDVRLAPDAAPPSEAHVVDVGRFLTMRTLLRGITDDARVHQVNVRLLAAAEASGP